MREMIQSRLRAAQRSFAAFTTGQKTVAIVGGVAVLLAAFMVFRWASAPTYAPLFTNLAPADASAVVDKLQSAGTPYQLTDGGATVMVPQADVYAARIQLSGEGLPSQSSTQGYGLLDNQSLSTSQFQQQTDYKRAIEGELEKTIEALDAVDTAVVHVAMPQQTLFTSNQAPTTASVLVKTQPGATLTSEQVQAIVHLVSASVEGLSPNQVTVTDSAGNVLSVAGQNNGFDSVSGSRDQEVAAFENRMQQQVQALLDRIVGPGNSAVQVTADLNFDKTVTHSTRYFTTPNAEPISGSTSTETYKTPGGSGTSGGVVGPDGQLLPGTTTGKGGATTYKKVDKTADNPVGTDVSTVEAAPGNLQSLHIGVVLNNANTKLISPAKVAQLISSGVGINSKRGDTVQVDAMPFDQTAAKAAAAALLAQQKADSQARMMSMARTGGLVLLVLLIALIAWLRSRKTAKLRQEATTYVVEQLRRGGDGSPEPVEAGSPTPALPGPAVAELPPPARDEIASLVERQPEEVAQLLRGWLIEADR